MHPEITIIVPIYQANLSIADTCESIRSQTGVSWEAIFIDAKEDPHASDVIKGYNDPRFSIQVLKGGSLFALMNRGLLLARGGYINLLLVGCNYLSPHSLKTVLESIRRENEPDIFYTACYVEGRLFYTNEWRKALETGFQPTLLQACFFKAGVFKTIGYFFQDLERRGTLEFFSRVCTYKDITVRSELRVYVEMLRFPKQLLTTWTIFRETWVVILRYFGLMAALKWLFSKRSIALIRKKQILPEILPRS
ncbi:MAG: glycosyltransferase [Verrucomicrobia bacterium]|nr:glycosyltransferase [Verrucomicrobiota bacterium]MBS0636015.1 glycosyltransferase [Verrucomicrobiota bacterium]